MKSSEFKINIFPFIRNLAKQIGIDATVGWSIINNLWMLLKKPLLMVFLLRYLTAEQQGVWYTFNSLGPLTLFAELGFSTIITQFVSHEYAKLQFEYGVIKGDNYYFNRLFSLIRYSIKFYFYIIPFAILILSIVGFEFFKTQPLSTIVAWFLFAIIVGLNLMYSNVQAIYQGLDRVKDIQKNLIIGSTFTTISNLTLLYFHYNIWALVVGNGVGLLSMLYYLYKKAPSFWKQIYIYKPTQKFNWYREIIPLQWKYALSWISGYLIFFLFVPIIYKYQGAVVAGQFGITLALIGALCGIADSWIGTKIPNFNIFVSNGQEDELHKLFKSSSKHSFVIFILGSIGMILVLYIFHWMHFYENRFLSIEYTSYLLVANISQRIVIYLAMYLRAHKIEPFYILSMLNAALISICVLFLYPQYGLTAMLIGVNIVYWLIIMPYAIFIYYSFRKKLRSSTEIKYV